MIFFNTFTFSFSQESDLPVTYYSERKVTCQVLRLLSALSVFNAEVIQDCLEIILHQQTGITEVTGKSVPFFQAAVIEQLMPVIDDKWDNPESKNADLTEISCR